MARVVLTTDAKEDLRDLDGAARKVVVKALRKLQADPEQRGAPLGRELSTYRKLVVGDRDYRIVYSAQEDGTICVVWVIAKRSNDEVYELARARLTAVTDDELQAMLRDALDQARSL